MGTEFTSQLGQPQPQVPGPMQEAVAQNAPTPQMQNIARGQDSNANGVGSAPGGMAKGAGRPAAPQLPMAPGPGNRMGAGGPGGMIGNIAQALMRAKGGMGGAQ